MQIFWNLSSDVDAIEVLRKNKLIMADLKKKISMLNANSQVSEDIEDESELVVDDEIIEEDEQEEEEEFEYYYKNIMGAISSCQNEDEIRQAIYDNLPVLENKNYCNIVRRIILELVKEQSVYETLKDGESIDEINELSKEQEKLKYYIDLIRKHREVESKIEVQNNHKKRNKLIFLTTNTGRIYAESDLASIDAEYYPRFYDLFESIENGTFKNVKCLSSNHDATKGLCEVKDFAIRIVFDRIQLGVYAIIDIFVKKSDWEKAYANQLTIRSDYYKSNKDVIIAQINDEYLAENEAIYENIKIGLMQKNITKTKKGV